MATVPHPIPIPTIVDKSSLLVPKNLRNPTNIKVIIQTRLNNIKSNLIIFVVFFIFFLQLIPSRIAPTIGPENNIGLSILNFRFTRFRDSFKISYRCFVFLSINVIFVGISFADFRDPLFKSSRKTATPHNVFRRIISRAAFGGAYAVEANDMVVKCGAA